MKQLKAYFGTILGTTNEEMVMTICIRNLMNNCIKSYDVITYTTILCCDLFLITFIFNFVHILLIPLIVAAIFLHIWTCSENKREQIKQKPKQKPTRKNPVTQKKKTSEC